MAFWNDIGVDKITSSIDIGGIFSGIMQGLGIFMMMIFIALVGGVVAYFILQWRKYNQKITIFEERAGYGLLPEKHDVAMLVRATQGGTQLLWCRKYKTFLNSYGKKIGKNHHAFVIGHDGIPINVSFGSYDKVLKEVNLRPTQAGLRLLHEQIGRHASAKYQQKNWIKDNIGVIFSIFSIVIVLLFMWLLADKYLTIQGSAIEAMKLSSEVLSRIDDTLAAMDNICVRQGFSGR